VTLLGSWGLNAWFLTPCLVIYACLPDARSDEAQCDIPQLSLRPYLIFLPVYLVLGTAVVVANNFTDVARPTPIPAAMQNAQFLWDKNVSEPMALVVTNSRAGQGMAFYSNDKPLILHRAPPEIYGWVLDDKYCSHGPVAVLVEENEEGETYLQQFVANFGQPDFIEPIKTEAMRVRLTMTTEMNFRLAGYSSSICFRDK